MNMNDKVIYTFHYMGQDGDGSEHPSTKSIDFAVDFDDSVQWTKVADEFFNFLSSIYGYRCSAKKYAAHNEAGI
jgi:hypothetical protein